MTRFTAGTEYATRSACDHNCIYRYLIVRRTDKSAWISEVVNGVASGEVVRKAIKPSYDNTCEVIRLESYSMAPILNADRLSENVKADWQR